MELLKIYTKVELPDGQISKVPFPQDGTQVTISEYEYTANRMGGAPTIQAKFKYPNCLDDLWNEKQFVEFRGCEYYVRETPSSSKSNDDIRYEHDVTFVHERVVLENVYMIDAIYRGADADNQPKTDKYVSNSTKVVFWGNLQEYVDRLNACLIKSKLGGFPDTDGYYVTIDDDVEKSEEMLIAFEDKFLSEAIQEVFNSYKQTYYWIGKVCHIGTAPEASAYQYSYLDSLLSVNRENTNEGYCNRATGVGSSDNIPYYYPNDVLVQFKPHALNKDDGVEGNKGITDDSSISVINNAKFSTLQQCLEQEKPYTNYGIQYAGFESSIQFTIDAVKCKALQIPQAWEAIADGSWGVYAPMKYADKAVTSWGNTYTYINAPSQQQSVYYTMHPTSADLWNIWLQYFVSKVRKYNSWQHYSLFNDWINDYCLSSPRWVDVIYHCVVTKRGDYCRMTFPIGYWLSDVPVSLKNIVIDITDANGNHIADLERHFYISTENEISPEGENLIHVDLKGFNSLGNDFWIHFHADIDKYRQYANKPSHHKSLDLSDPFATYFYQDNVWVDNGITAGYTGYLGYKGKQYQDLEVYRLISKNTVTKVKFRTPIVTAIPPRWFRVGEFELDTEHDLEYFGLASPQTAVDGDRIVRLYQESLSRIPIATNLMPTIYRDTHGEESFYNAINDVPKSEYSQYGEFYEDEDGAMYHFPHEFSPENPREYKFTFDDIKPTIKGMINIDGKPLDKFVDVAFDDNDHDFVKDDAYGSDLDDFESELGADTEYEHSYFFVKLPRTRVKDADGYSFNLFGSASPDEMNLSITSGLCGGCKFTVIVDKETRTKNPVVIDLRTGLPKRDKYGRVVLVGTSSASEYDTYQSIQQDTANREVWVCLMKETDTYGIVMPNVTSQLRPKQGDSFVILNIYLPKAYVRDAEDRLSKAIIKAMHDANTEKFSFSLSFSRIFLNNNPALLAHIDENALLSVLYNNRNVNLFVSSFSYKVSSGDVLPEITVDLTSNISASIPFAQNEQQSITEPINVGGTGGVYVIGMDDLTPPSDVSVYSSKRSDWNYISKQYNDFVNGIITFLKGIVAQGTSIFEKIISQTMQITELFDVGDYVRGVTGSQKGVRILPNGDIIAKSLFLEDSLYVPTIQYNRAMVLLGVFIVAPSAGEIESVEPDQMFDRRGNRLYHKVNEVGLRLYYDEYGNETTSITPDIVTTTAHTLYPLYEPTGRAVIKLEPNEVGSISVGDMLLGFWHTIDSGNTPSDGVWNEEQQTMVHNGDIQLSGFSSVYFRVVSIEDYDTDKKAFRYVLRCSDDSEWSDDTHPQSGMSFYGFGNIEDPERQSILMMTREYTVRLINKSWWTYDYDNIISIEGKLDGFAMRARTREGEDYIKWFSGYGRVGGNEYIFGNIDQFERVAHRLEIIQSKGGVLAPNEEQTITIKVYDGYGADITDQFNSFTIERNSGDAEKDEEWNRSRKGLTSNVFTLSYNDLNLREGINVCSFTVTASNGIITLSLKSE